MTSENAPQILVVDDDAALIRMVRLALTSEGFQVVTANDGLQALEVLESQQVDVIVLDLLMPRMNGRSFNQALKDRGSTIPVIVVTAYGADLARIDMDVDAVLNKPFDPDVLVREVRKLIGEHSTAPSSDRGRAASGA